MPQEAQEGGNVINLPPKEELDELLKVHGFAYASCQVKTCPKNPFRARSLKVRKKLAQCGTGNFSDYGAGKVRGV